MKGGCDKRMKFVIHLRRTKSVRYDQVTIGRYSSVCPTREPNEIYPVYIPRDYVIGDPAAAYGAAGIDGKREEFACPIGVHDRNENRHPDVSGVLARE